MLALRSNSGGAIAISYNALVRTLCSAGAVAPSQTPLDHQLQLHRVRELCSRGQLQEALSLFYAVNPHFDAPTYAALFHACARLRQLDLGRSLHQYLLAHHRPSFNGTTQLYLRNHLVNMYGKCGHLDFARQVFDNMPHRNIVSWTALISGYGQCGRSDECFSVFADMLDVVRPTEFAFAAVLSSCRYYQGRQVHVLALKTSFDAYVFVANALITMYSRGSSAGECGHDDGDEALKVFGNMECCNLISWNSMIAGFQNRGLWAQAVKFFTQMHSDGIGFDRATLLSTLSALCDVGNDHVVKGFWYCLQLHCLSIRTAFSLEAQVSTALVKAYSTLGGGVRDCYKMFMDSSGLRDIISWTGIIATVAEKIPQAALSFFCQLRRDGWNPDRYTLSSVLKACAGLMTERHASAVHLLIVKAGFEGDIVLANALIHSYARCGALCPSKKVFDELGNRDTVSWNSMLKAYALHGQAGGALELFSKMDVQPDAATFVAILSACSHAGMAEEGVEVFDNMSEKYGVVPGSDHYACMIDMFGRAGRIVEAKNLITRMPMEPDSVVWSALLAACRKHNETELGMWAATKLRELDPDNSLGYVLMSNIFCLDGNFDDAGFLWKKMKGSGVRKNPGLSWVEVGNRVHEFASGGLRHPHREAIYDKLETLVGQLKVLGYVPETSLVLHDVEEEQKAEQLYHHSEKLAVVYALIDADSRYPFRLMIKIMKNIRICADCHNFMKFVSELTEKEIIVRDSNRFHHFNKGACSCNDFW
ncbi:hypothetical protein Dimus_005965 [Dionaea muscipula]